MKILTLITLTAFVGTIIFLFAFGESEADTPTPLPPIGKADHVLVEKSKNKVSLLKNKKVIAEYHAVFGFNPVGHKEKEGDGRTPEGTYTLDYRNAKSQYYKSIHISYPNEEDKKKAKKKGVSPGGLIMLHGQPNGIGHLWEETQKENWTLGCIAVNNAAIDQIWNSVDDGTVITIKP